jgi:hypothetical protein
MKMPRLHASEILKPSQTQYSPGEFEQSNNVDVGGYDTSQQQSTAQSHLETPANFKTIQQDAQPPTLAGQPQVMSKEGEDGLDHDDVLDAGDGAAAPERRAERKKKERFRYICRWLVYLCFY